MDSLLDRQLHIFRTAARLGSFTGAAKALDMTQPGVSFRIKQLEADLNTRLFDRHRSHVTLTAAGMLVCEYADRILGAYADMFMRLGATTGKADGPLLVGAPSIAGEFVLPRVLAAFVKAHPQVQPRLVLDDSRAIERRVAEGTLDIGFIEEAGRRKSLPGEFCWQDELVAIAGRTLPLARLPEACAGDLVDYPFVFHAPGSDLRKAADAFLAAGGTAPDTLEVLMETDSPTSLNALVETGAGIAITSRASVAAALRLGDLVAIPLRPRLFWNLRLVQQKKQPLSVATSLFGEFTVSRLCSLVRAVPWPDSPPSRRESAPLPELVV